MNIQQFFNIVLLALSVTTILLTIISYLLYRIRQMPGATTKSVETIRTQGAFFKRYLPKELADVNNVSATQTKMKFIELPRRIVPLFGILACVIFIALFASMVIGTSSEQSADTSTAAFKALRAKGLLKDYEVTQQDFTHVTDEYLYPQQAKELGELMASLKNKRIQLVDFNFVPPAPPTKSRAKKSKTANKAPETKERAIADSAVAGWRTFMTAHQFNFETTNKVDCSTHPDLVILPHASRLSEEATHAIEACVEAKVSMLATGPIGSEGQLGAPGTDPLSETVFGVRLSTSDKQGSEPTTVFLETPGLAWAMPPGLILNWAMLDSAYKAVAVHGESAAYETLGNGFATNYVRAQFYDDAGSRRAWLAFDPIKEASVSAVDRYYRRVALTSALAWASRIPHARIASWPGEKAAALLLSVDSEDKFENVAELRKVFESTKAPATFFLVSNLFTQHPEAFRGTSSFELASHSENHAIFSGQPLNDQFDRIQTSRHEIEETSAQRVHGFRAPEERYDDATLSAVVQNHLDYFAVNRRFMRFSPLMLAGGSTLLFPRMTIDDFGLSKREDLKTADAYMAALIDDASEILRVGGMNLINVHTQLAGANSTIREGLKKAIPMLQQRGFWLATYSQATNWWRARSQVEISVQASGETYGVHVTNSAKEPMDDVVVEVDLGQDVSKHELRLTEQTTTPSRAVAQAQKFNHSISIGHLQPNETRTFLLEPASH